MKTRTLAFAAATANAALEVRSKLGKTAAVVMAILAAAVFAGTANAAVFTVTNANDAGAGSLRQAVLDANAAPGADSVFFSPTVFNQSFNSINVNTEIPITGDISINGIPSRVIAINGGASVRHFTITNAVVDINNLMFSGGQPTAGNNGGSLLVNGGATTLFNVTFFGNTSVANGGAIHVQAGSLSMTNATFFANTATTNGGAISVDNPAANVQIMSASFAGNTANSGSGGAIAVTNGLVSVGNSAFGPNVAPTGQCIAGSFTSLGYNIIANIAGATVNGITTGNRLNVNPQLGSISNWGGSTWTFNLQPGSPAIDAGDAGQASLPDQRLARRNTDGNYDGVAGVDVGAFEKQNALFDVDGDGSADPAITRTSGPNLAWWQGYFQISTRPESLTPQPNAASVQVFGLPTDLVAAGDFDGDGKQDAAVFRPSTGIWYINQTTAGFRAFQWGVSGDVPVPADYDGDGKDDVAVYRAGVWYIFRSTQGYTGPVTLGGANDKPVPADYDGDLKADVATFRNGFWQINKSTGGQIQLVFGLAGDIPVAADYDGNGTDNLAVFRPSNATWYVQRPAGGYDSTIFGLSTDIPAPADFDGDGKTDVAVFRGATNGRGQWHILQSRDGYIVGDWGVSTDSPVAGTRRTP